MIQISVIHTGIQCVCVCVCVCVYVCVCFCIILYVNSFGRTVLYICIEYHIYVIKYYVNSQRVDDECTLLLLLCSVNPALPTVLCSVKLCSLSRDKHFCVP